MAGDRIARATARIEAAVRRIEAAATSSTGASDPGGDPELAGKYHALRSEAGEALAELDRLIGSLEP